MADTTDLRYQTENTQRPIVKVEDAMPDQPEAIEREIDYTRAQLATTIGMIGDKLSPDRLMEQAKDTVRDATVGRIKDMTYQAERRVEGARQSLAQTVRDNPLPVAVIGLGLGWLLLSSRDKGVRTEEEYYETYPYRYPTSGYRYYEGERRGYREYGGGRDMMDEARDRFSDVADTARYRAEEMQERVSDTAERVTDRVSNTADRITDELSDTAERVADTVSETAHRVTDTVSHRASDLQDRTSDMAMRTREEADRLRAEARWRAEVTANKARQSFTGMLDENPLSLGLALLLAGAAIGAMLPPTRTENEFMGEQRDRFVDEAKTRAQDMVERVQNVVEEAQTAAVDEAKREAKRQNLPTGEGRSASQQGMSS